MEGEASEAKERGRAASQKTKVRFDLNDSSSIKSERRSSSVETYTRKTTVTSSKPPTDKQQPRRPVVKANEAAGPTAKWRTASAERPATMSPNTERTLQEIGKETHTILKVKFLVNKFNLDKTLIKNIEQLFHVFDSQTIFSYD